MQLPASITAFDFLRLYLHGKVICTAATSLFVPTGVLAVFGPKLGLELCL